MDRNLSVFFELVRAGLWENDVRLAPYGEVDYAEVLQLAEEQSVVGLIAAGIEHIVDKRPQKKDVLQFIGRTVQLEQRNQAMSWFTAEVVERMYKEGLHPLLVKGQGLAQCYERPSWRSVGDVDFFFAKEEFRKAADFFTDLSGNVVQDARYTKSFGVVIDPWFIEIHGTLRSGLSTRLDKVIDAVQANTFTNGEKRVWRVGKTDVQLPCVDNDVFLVFTHFVRHCYKGGVSLRQVCDWCRLLWTYRSEFDVAMQERWIHKAGLMGEWQALAALAVEYLGMPAEAMPLVGSDVQGSGSRLSRKAERLLSFILAGGGKHKVRDTFALAKIFPGNTVKFLPSIFLNVNWLKVKERLLKSK